MARAFFSLSLIAVAVLVANLVLGFVIGDYNGAAERLREARERLDEQPTGAARREFVAAGHELESIIRWQTVHLLLGVVGALVTLLVNSVSVTYFIGTSRWCKEVVETYALDEELARRSNRLKRQTFPFALAGILTIIGIITLGAASDPSANLSSSSSWVIPHYLGAIGGTALIAWSFLAQVGKIGANYDVIEEILADVERIRREKGLD